MIGVQVAILCLLPVAILAKPTLPFHAKWLAAQSKNVEEQSGNFQGDMILSPKQLLALKQRTGYIAERYRWPNKTVPYELSDDFTDEQKQFIRQSLDMIEEVSCVRFVPKNASHNSYVLVRGDDAGCSSSVGFQNRRQTLNLAPNVPGQGCFRNGTIVHEFLHALGFFHMQSASDRDDFVTIVWDNINPMFVRNFEKFDDTVISHFGVRYDYDSVMHYPRTAFTMNDEDTIVPLDPEAEIGQRVRLSQGDIDRLNNMYDCQARN
ncbi:seminal metalloprotease 1-like [Phlebotomus argentipes]|uniref:seminal metalloprotease 1-like n=1 Tax=Phlebotomus argentipes TaxID=94469 RepID=UPI0028934B8C|nr:seminal metalloprotease 1-like [Phlebotomus argentipes]